MAIPKTITTFWFSSEGRMPPLIQKCIESQKIPGYEHRLITLDNCFKDHWYVQQAIAAKKFVKLTDFLRMYYLYTDGGVTLDADVEILPGKNFDSLLNHRMFAAKENNGFIGVAVMGSEKGHPFVKKWMEWVESNFRGDDSLNFESSMEPVVHGYYEWGWDIDGFELVPTNVLYPYDHQSGSIIMKDDTITYHHFFKSWLQPKLTFIIPTMGMRPEGLKRCVDSINALNYEPGKVEIIAVDGPGIVPGKVAYGYEMSTGEWIVYAADDMEFTPDSVKHALVLAQEGYELIAFNGGEILPDEGNICEHFMIKKSFVRKLENKQIFSTDFHHVGCDNWLWAQARKMGKAIHCSEALITHNHFSKGFSMDETYAQGWSHVEQDRATLKEKLAHLYDAPEPSTNTLPH